MHPSVWCVETKGRTAGSYFPGQCKAPVEAVDGCEMLALCYCLAFRNLTETTQLQQVCQVSYLYVLPVLLGVTVLTNILNVAVLLRPRPNARARQTPARTYLLWLGLSHCTVCGLVLLALSLGTRWGLSYAWAFYLAHVEQPLYGMFNCSCAYIIMALSMERYRAVRQPYQYSAVEKPLRRTTKILLAYVIPAALYLPKCFAQAAEYNEEQHGWRVTQGIIFDTASWRVWSVMLELLHRVVPSVTLVVLNVLILQAVRRVRAVRASMRVPRKRRESTHGWDNQIRYLLIVLTAAFLLSNVPAAVLQLLYTAEAIHCSTSLTSELARTVANCLEIMGVCCDFFLYFVMNSEYRRDLQSLVVCMCGRCGCCGILVRRCPGRDESSHYGATFS